MTAELSTAIISAAAAIAAAAVGYVLTKRIFVSSLGGTIEGETSLQGQEVFTRACNDMLLFSPLPVLKALRSVPT
jgi:hypothetical protein